MDEAVKQLAKAIASHLGWKGSWGGWIHDRDGNPVAQGWVALAAKLKHRGWIVERGHPFPPHVNWRKVPHAL
jgi:hypothetical protein